MRDYKQVTLCCNFQKDNIVIQLALYNNIKYGYQQRVFCYRLDLDFYNSLIFLDIYISQPHISISLLDNLK